MRSTCWKLIVFVGVSFQGVAWLHGCMVVIFVEVDDCMIADELPFSFRGQYCLFA